MTLLFTIIKNHECGYLLTVLDFRSKTGKPIQYALVIVLTGYYSQPLYVLKIRNPRTNVTNTRVFCRFLESNFHLKESWKQEST